MKLVSINIFLYIKKFSSIVRQSVYGSYKLIIMLEKCGGPHLKNGPNALNWQCWLAGSSKSAPRILIFSIAVGANYSNELNSVET